MSNHKPISITLSCLKSSPFGWKRVVSMAVLVLNLPVLAVDEKLGALVLTNLASGIDGILLFVEVTATTRSPAFFDVPASGVTGR